MKLLSLRLREFKGIQEFDLIPEGKSISVLGDNGVGKSSIYDAWTFLLFGKDSLGRSDFEIKRLLNNGEPVRGIDHEVEGVISINGDPPIKIKKIFREKWTRRRGQAEKEFSGNETQHFINGVPIKESEYTARIANIAKEKILRVLSDPSYFAERLHWQERRQMLLEICGDVADEDVIASSRDLDDLPDILDGKSLDDYRKIAAARKRKINGELQLVPARIDEVSRSLPEMSCSCDSVGSVGCASPYCKYLQAIDLDESKIHLLGLGKQILKLRAERNEYEEARARIKSGGEIAERTKHLREIEATIIEERNERRAKVNAETDKKRQELSGAKDELDTAVRQNGQIENYIANAEGDVQAFEKRMEELRKRWHEIDAEVFAAKPGDDTCAACGQTLPEDRVEEARAKAEAEFNSDKARKLHSISDEGTQIKERHDKLVIERTRQKEKLAQGGVLIDELRERVEALQASQNEQVVGVGDHPSDVERDLAKQKQEIEAEIETLKGGNADALAEAEKEISDVDTQIAEVEGKLSRIEQRRSSEKRIEELKAQERLLAAEYEELERGLYLCEEFTRRKVSMLTERINGRFELARFKLFDIQVNGAIAECCEVTHEGVPWPSMNTGSQVNVGLDIIRTMSEHYGICPPIFVDHSESITELLDTPGQQIRLIVSKPHKELHVEEVKR